MSDAELQPIKLIGCDEEGVARDSRKKSAYVIPFLLSSRPSREWIEEFDESWRRGRKESGIEKFRAYVKKNDIYLECGLDNLNVCFPALKMAIERANEAQAKIAKDKSEKAAKKRAKQEQRAEQESNERAIIHAALEQLDFS